MSEVCGFTWDYQPPYSGVRHKRHDCGQAPDHRPGDHKCSRCDCWLNPFFDGQFRADNEYSVNLDRDSE